MSLSRIKLPQALVVVALIAAVTLVLLFGPDADLRGWVLRLVVGVLSGAGLLGTGAMGSFVRPKPPADDDISPEEHRRILDARMPSLERTAGSARRADELIARAEAESEGP